VTRDEAQRNGYYFPWTPPGSCGRTPVAMRWEAKTPGEKSWKDLLEKLENGGPRRRLAREHGIGYRYLCRIFRRYRRWKAGIPIVPVLDPLPALMEAQHEWRLNSRSEQEST
jgi:hypothetical protein